MKPYIIVFVLRRGTRFCGAFTCLMQKGREIGPPLPDFTKMALKSLFLNLLL